MSNPNEYKKDLFSTDEVMTKQQLVHFLKISETKINNMIRYNQMPYYRMGKRILFLKKDILAWMENFKNKVVKLDEAEVKKDTGE